MKKKIVIVTLIVIASMFMGAILMYVAILNGFSVSVPRITFESYNLGLQKTEVQDGQRRVIDADGTVWVYAK